METDAGSVHLQSAAAVPAGESVVRLDPARVPCEIGTASVPGRPNEWQGTVVTRAFLGDAVDHIVRIGQGTVRVRGNPSVSIEPPGPRSTSRSSRPRSRSSPSTDAVVTAGGTAGGSCWATATSSSTGRASSPRQIGTRGDGRGQPLPGLRPDRLDRGDRAGRGRAGGRAGDAQPAGRRVRRPLGPAAAAAGRPGRRAGRRAAALAALTLTGAVAAWHVVLALRDHRGGDLRPAVPAGADPGPGAAPDCCRPRSRCSTPRASSPCSLGPAIGGVLIAVAGPGLVYLFDAVTYAAAHRRAGARCGSAAAAPERRGRAAVGVGGAWWPACATSAHGR